MKTASTILTIALLIPIVGNLFSAYSYYAMSTHNQFMSFNKTVILTSYVPALIFDLIAVVIAVILSANRKYLANTVMCATVVGGFVIHTTLYYVFFALSTWLKLA